MNYTTHELSNLILRWTHVAGATFWIGQAVLLAKWTRQMANVDRSPDASAAVRLPGPVSGAPLLRAASATTWISGFLLLGLMYHHGGALTVPDAPLGRWASIAVSVGVLPLGWLVYDTLWSRLAARPKLASLLSVTGLVGAIVGLNELFSPRAMYLHTGAILATIMAANVWFRLAPAARRRERESLADSEGEWQALDEAGLEARAWHNLRLAIPVVFTMVSSHFPTTTFGSSAGVPVLVGLLAFGFFVGRFHVR